MVGWLVVSLLLAGAPLAVCSRRLWRAWRYRHSSATMFVTNYPGIELDQPYGGWDADAYDSRPNSVSGIIPVRIQPVVPGRWARLI